ncbi:MAG: glycoside hydrolase family 31 protein [Ruminiclostridium sp.]|nr:glycoside hydrolase family 31 protein [Ruminiclostridium sp.]
MIRFYDDNGALVMRLRDETVRIEGWGKNALRVRAARLPKLPAHEHALTEPVSHDGKVSINAEEMNAVITNGRIKATVNPVGIICFYRDDKLILQEYYSSYGGSIRKHPICYKIVSREYKGNSSDDFRITVRFESDPDEKLFGMGQYQMPILDLKGTVLPLEQRNSQVTIPFVVSDRGYGMLWNNPATGEAAFGKNITKWVSTESDMIDYWITAEDTPAKIVENYTECVGRAPVLSKNYLGLWQCKLRYRTPEEALEVARKYKELGIHLDVIVIDFFHWPYQGDWKFDEKYWPKDKLKAMVDEIHGMGTKIMVSVWPSVDKRSENYYKMEQHGLISSTDIGSLQTYDYQGDCATVDFFNPEAQKFVWDCCKKNYRDLGIDLFWLDNSEPDSVCYDFENFRYYSGRGSKVGCEYPKMYLKAFCDGLTADGEKDFVSLIRSAWVGSQKYRGLVWTGDIQSNFESFRDQVIAGQNMGLAGIPWWTTDIGGFMTDDWKDPDFVELLIRWYQYGAFCPILRMHGDRGPNWDIPALDDRDFGGGYLYTGHPNELWSYGDECFNIMKKYLGVRESLKDYIASLMEETSKTGAPLIRTMFFEFPDDKQCWDLPDQYMFGSQYLVAPVLELGARERTLYLPAGTWESIEDKQIVEGGRFVTVPAPLDVIPVFRKIK